MAFLNAATDSSYFSSSWLTCPRWYAAVAKAGSSSRDFSNSDAAFFKSASLCRRSTGTRLRRLIDERRVKSSFSPSSFSACAGFFTWRT